MRLEVKLERSLGWLQMCLPRMAWENGMESFVDGGWKPTVTSSIFGKSFHFPFPYFVLFVLRYFPFHMVYIYTRVYIFKFHIQLLYLFTLQRGEVTINGVCNSKFRQTKHSKLRVPRQFTPYSIVL